MEISQAESVLVTFQIQSIFHILSWAVSGQHPLLKNFMEHFCLLHAGIALHSLYSTATCLLLLDPPSNTARQETDAQKGQINFPRFPSQYDLNPRQALFTNLVSYMNSLMMKIRTR